MQLSFSLVQVNKILPAVLRDERLKPMLENMSKTYTGPEYGAGGRKSVEHVTAGDVDELAQAAFPLCMQAMHGSLKEKHKLKHLGRLQYGLFLKGLGLPMEEALAFWQREFTKGMPADEFLKKVSSSRALTCLADAGCQDSADFPADQTAVCLHKLSIFTCTSTLLPHPLALPVTTAVLMLPLAALCSMHTTFATTTARRASGRTSRPTPVSRSSPPLYQAVTRCTVSQG